MQLRSRLGLLPSLEPVHVDCPYLHHKSLFRQNGRPVVGSSVGIPCGLGQLMFDEVEPEAQDLIQNGSRHGPEAMHRHPVRLGCEAFRSQRMSVVGR